MALHLPGKLDAWFSDWSGRKSIVLLALLAGYTFLLFAPTWSYEFVYDDFLLIDGDSAVAQPSLLLQGDTFLRRSLRTLTLALDHALWGKEPLGYHLTNVLLHVMVVLALFLLLLQLFQRPLLAFLAALLFAAHPVHVEVVAGIANRKDSLALLFGLWSIFFFLLKERNWILYALSLVSLLLTFVSKEVVGVSIPVLFLVTDLLRAKAAGERALWPRLAFYYAPIVVAGVVCLSYTGYGRLWQYFQPEHLETLTLLPNDNVTYGDVISHAVAALGYNVKLLYLPWGYSVEHYLSWWSGSSVAPEESSPLLHFDFYLGLFHLLVLPALVIRACRRRPLAKNFCVMVWGIAFFCLTYLPISNLIPFQHQRLVAERYLYAPSVGFVLLLALGLVRLRPLSRPLGTAAVLTVVTVFSASTFVHSESWRNQYSLFRELALSPTAPVAAVSHFTEGCILEGKYAEGVETTRSYLRRFHGRVINYPQVYENLAICLRESGEPEKSTQVLFEALRASPNSIVLKTLLHENADRYMRAGDHDRSEAILEEFLSGRIRAHRRFLAGAHLLMGFNAIAREKQQKATEHFAQSVELAPNADAHCALGQLQYGMGNRAAAEKHLRAALRLDRRHEISRALLRRFGMESAGE